MKNSSVMADQGRVPRVMVRTDRAPRVMAGEGRPSTSLLWFASATRGWPAFAGHDARGVTRAALFALLSAFLLACVLVRPASAVEPSERLANPALEARAEAIGSVLRCLVCQNESIEESGADLAHDIRVLLRKRLLAGDTNQQAIQAIVSRYGQFVLLKPPVEPATYVLWFAPAGLLVIGLLGILLWLRRRHTTDAAAPLSAAEQRRLDNLLQETEQ